MATITSDVRTAIIAVTHSIEPAKQATRLPATAPTKPTSFYASVLTTRVLRIRRSASPFTIIRFSTTAATCPASTKLPDTIEGTIDRPYTFDTTTIVVPHGDTHTTTNRATATN